MTDLTDQLRDYGQYLDRLDVPVELAESDGVVPRPRRVGAALVVGALCLVGLVLVALAIDTRSPRRDRAVDAPTTSGDRATPAPTVAPADQAMFPGAEPTVTEQIARLRSWYANAAADAPGGRPMLAAEAVFCDVDGKRTPVGADAFVSDQPLDVAIGTTQVVAACAKRAEMSRSDMSSLTATVCVGRRRGPIYDATRLDVQSSLPKLVVIYGDQSCARAGYEPATPAFLDTMNARRALEIKLRAVPRDCPSYEETAAWVRKVSTEAGHPFTTSPLGSTNACAFRSFVDWDVGVVFIQ